MSVIKRPAALITGCSPGGLGFELVKAFEARGFHVFATARNPAKILTSSMGANVEAIPLDVVSRESIASCLEHVRKRTGDKLDVLVNNAGVMLMGPLVHASMEDARKTYDVNVFGTLAVAQAFTPLLARARGVILNISSLAGAIPMAWQGVYNSSKAAKTFLSETLRIELEPVGIRVVTAMVGEMSTNIYDHVDSGEGFSPSLPKESWYKPVEDIIRAQGRGQLQLNNEDPRITAQNLVNDTLGGKRGKTWRGGVAGFASVASWLLPGRLFEWILHKDRGVYNPSITRVAAAQSIQSVG
ncbi:putative short-chain dehydrogenase/reductase [Hypoxylon rubiginosum]|uniref:Short-chain dehydrogenase/reductase n=1 Tax=Hypoxylon rubiginosum TaxID=110542 RepID=A0ACC0CWT2_9PEZI|nr:putative short-chain dehydrogenase/reductase [Hypoxylon rubiginosum]